MERFVSIRGYNFIMHTEGQMASLNANELIYNGHETVCFVRTYVAAVYYRTNKNSHVVYVDIVLQWYGNVIFIARFKPTQ